MISSSFNSALNRGKEQAIRENTLLCQAISAAALDLEDLSSERLNEEEAEQPIVDEYLAYIAAQVFVSIRGQTCASGMRIGA